MEIGVRSHRQSALSSPPMASQQHHVTVHLLQVLANLQYGAVSGANGATPSP